MIGMTCYVVNPTTDNALLNLLPCLCNPRNIYLLIQIIVGYYYHAKCYTNKVMALGQ